MKIKKFLIVFILLIIILSFTIINAFYININTITIREETISSSKIDKDLDGLTIAFIADIHYSNRVKDNIMQQLVDKINLFDVDVVIFGGDLFEIDDTKITEENMTSLSAYLKAINAPYGKYAILGNHDLSNDNIRSIVDKVLYNGEFEILSNSSVMIRKDSNAYINLVGIDSMLNGSPDINEAYSRIRNEAYTIAVCHTPDIFDEIPQDSTDLLLCGHSHGGQIYLPIINNFYRPYGAKNYFKGKYTQNDTTLDITNGIGTTEKDIRLFADAEIVIYKFMND